MATYKVLQDIEAEDKLIGPLTLRQCLYAAIAIIAMYLSYLFAAKGASFMIAFLLPFIGFGLFFAWPWGQQQSTEVWALAKVRFALKPRKRIWDQSGAKDLVTVTAPKVVERHLSSNMSETEVRSRLKALAETIDSRGWATKNVPLGLYTQPYNYQSSSDRLIETGNMPQEVSSYGHMPSDDMFDMDNNPIAQQFETKMTAVSTARHQQLISQIDNPVAAPAAAAPAGTGNDYWYGVQPVAAPLPDPMTATPSLPYTPQAATPTEEDERLAEEIRRKQELIKSTYSNTHIRTIQPLSVQAAQSAQSQNVTSVTQTPEPSVTPQTNPAILELANNNDLNVATLAREAQRNIEAEDEVVVSLH